MSNLALNSDAECNSINEINILYTLRKIVFINISTNIVLELYGIDYHSYVCKYLNIKE